MRTNNHLKPVRLNSVRIQQARFREKTLGRLS